MHLASTYKGQHVFYTLVTDWMDASFVKQGGSGNNASIQ